MLSLPPVCAAFYRTRQLYQEISPTADIGQIRPHRNCLRLLVVVLQTPYNMTIRSFKCKHTRMLFEGIGVIKFANFKAAAERKLHLLDNATTLDFLRSPPGNHLEALKGERKGQHSIRVNGQFRICFVWTDIGPENVEITDYH